MSGQPGKIPIEEFSDIVDRSFLSASEKILLKRAAEGGVTERLWRRFDALLVAALEERKRIERKYKSRLDSEARRHIEEYEIGKHDLDLQMREDLIRCGKLGDAEAKALWDEYHRRLAVLREKLLANVNRSSKDVLRQAAAAVSGRCPE